jgi:ABC-type phosphate transport system substrate-binding protein
METMNSAISTISGKIAKAVRTVYFALFILSLLMTLLAGCGGSTEEKYALEVYTRSDACGASEIWAKYLGNYTQEDLKGTGVYGDPGLAEAVKKDQLGIGYNNLNYVYDMATGEQISGLRVIPIDLNENGRIDADEDFYANKTLLTTAVATGRYPSPPARDENLVTKDEFKGIAREFVRWILTGGQKYCSEVGYVALPEEKVENELAKLGNVEPGTEFEGEITISGAWALYPMMVKWTEEFHKVYPDVRFNLSAGGAGKGMADALADMVDIGMVSRGIYPAEIEKGAFSISVTKDAVVPVVNADNPALEELLAKGIKKQTFADIWIAGNVTDWRDVTK